MSESLLSLLGDKNFERLTFLADEPVLMVIEDIVEKEKGVSIRVVVLNGEHATKKHTIYSNYYMTTKKGLTLLNPTLSMVVRTLLQKELMEAKPKEGASLEEKLRTIIDVFFANIDEKIIGKTIKVTYKPVEGEFQNIKSIEVSEEKPKVAASPKEVNFD